MTPERRIRSTLRQLHIGKHSLCLSELLWPCCDLIVAVKFSPTAFISQTTQVSIPSVDTVAK